MRGRQRKCVLELMGSLLKKLVERRQLASARYFLWARNARRDAKATREFSRQSGIPLVDIWESPILQKFSGKMLFILGSGSSVNDLTASQFAHIANNQSIGVNFWYFHDFVPNVFSFDGGKVDTGHQDISRTLRRMGQLFDRKSIIDSRPKILYLRPLNSDSKFLVPVPTSLKSERWVSARANFISRDRLVLKSDLRLILKKIAGHSTPSAVLPDNGSSVVRMIFLGLAQGYKDIVLTGVDLDNRPHFWASEKYVRRYKDYVELFAAPSGEMHETTQATDRPLGNVEFLALLANVMAEEGAGRLWVSSAESRLSAFLPQYLWPRPAGDSAVSKESV